MRLEVLSQKQNNKNRKLIMINYYQKTKEFLHRNEQYLSPIAMLCGFVIDNLTLRRIDLLVENLVIVSYLAIALVCIIFINYYEGREYVLLEDDSLRSKLKRLINFKKHKEKVLEKISIFAPFLLQLVFGGLFSVFVVFYTRSASIFNSWPFILFLFLLLIGNEFFREKYSKISFQLLILFIAVFSYSVFFVPIVLGKMGVFSFLLSGFLSLAIITLVFRIVRFFIPKKLELAKESIWKGIVFIYLVFNFLYFSNIIPPIPLSLTDDGVFHSLQRLGSTYQVEYEPAPWYQIFNDEDSTVRWRPGARVYYYSAIFAPTKISTKIYHKWSFFDEKKSKWVEKSLLNYPIMGGRDEGYRGYSYKSGLAEGDWRVEVVTERGQVLGRKDFKIIEVGIKPKLKKSEK